MKLLLLRDATSYRICLFLFILTGVFCILEIICFAKKWDLKTHLEILALIIACLGIGLGIYAPAHREIVESVYQEATEKYEAWKCSEARHLYEMIPKYKDSSKCARECSYFSATEYIKRGEYVKAMEQLHGYLDGEKGAALFTEAQGKLEAENSENLLSELDMQPSKWVEEDGERYLSITEKGNGITIKTTFTDNFLNYYDVQYKNGFIHFVRKNKVTPKIALQYDPNTSKLHAYLYGNGTVVTLVQQLI